MDRDKMFVSVRLVYVRILSSVEVPIMILTLFGLCMLGRSHRVALVFVLHLILSDLIQIICQLIFATQTARGTSLSVAYYYSLVVSVYFMACVAFERYLLVSHPIWHKTHNSHKFCCVTSLIIWFVPLVFASKEPPYLHFRAFRLSIVCLIPYLITLLCFFGTWRGLSHSISLTHHRRKMILGSLFLVLLNYTFVFLPFMVLNIFHHVTANKFKDTFNSKRVESFLFCLLYLNPLVDCLLYLFMRTDVVDRMSSPRCCCTSDTQQISV